MAIYRFDVTGLPATAGSKTPGVTKDGRVYLRPSNPHQKRWQRTIQNTVKALFSPGKVVMAGPKSLQLTFYLPRPKAHFRTGRYAQFLKKDAPKFHLTKPDLSKLVRCAEDALTGLLWNDDRQVVYITARKLYCTSGEPPGMSAEVSDIILSG